VATASLLEVFIDETERGARGSYMRVATRRRALIDRSKLTAQNRQQKHRRSTLCLSPLSPLLRPFSQHRGEVVELPVWQAFP
jgi:hypothetical protein